MTRKELNAFDSNKLGVRKSRIFEVRNPKTGFGEHHYFYRDYDGELFNVVCKGVNEAIRLRDEWRKKKEMREDLQKFADEYENREDGE
jgi:hypothetical protein